MVEVLGDEVFFGADAIMETIEQLQQRTQQILENEQYINGNADEEYKSGSEDGEGNGLMSLREPLSTRWAKEALCIVTQHLSEQQKISLLSGELTLLTYQPQEATADDVNFKEELRRICDQLTFEVEQKELAVLAAPTRLQ